MKTVSARKGRRPLAVFLAFLIDLAGIAIVSPAARAGEVVTIGSTGVKLAKVDAEEATIYMWSNARVDANWSILGGTRRVGDTLRIVLLKELEGAEDTSELKGREGDQLTYGNYGIAKTGVVCTLNVNVEGKNNVGGSLWVKTQIIVLATAPKLNLEVNSGTRVGTPLPNGQQGIDYKPYVPTETGKPGWSPGVDQGIIHWRIMTPGDRISDRSSVTIADDYLQAESNLTVSVGYSKISWIPSAPRYWNEPESTECRNDLNNSSVPSSIVAIDDDRDQVKAVPDNKGQNSQVNWIYVFGLELTTDGGIPVGFQYVNRGFADGEVRIARTVKISSGGDTSSGGTVGHISVKKAVTNGNIPGDTVFPVTWSYRYKGATCTGELSVRADGIPETLNNTPSGVVVTLAEKILMAAGVDFDDPMFSDAGVGDGAPGVNSTRARVEDLKAAEMTLTNPVIPVVKPILSRVDVTPGACVPGASGLSEPTVEAGPTDGVTYSVPEFARAGDQVMVKVTATSAAGRKISGQNLSTRWIANNGGSFTFITMVTQPTCERVVTSVAPIVDPGVCPVDSTIPIQPTVTGVENTEQIDYNEPVVVVNGDRVAVTVIAAAKLGYRIDTADLLEGWSVVGGVVTYTTTITQPKCMVPIAPKINVDICPADSLMPTPPSAAFNPVKGLEFSKPEAKVRGRKVTVTATMTAEAGFQIGGPLPGGWTRMNEITAKFATTKDQPVCQPKKVVPVTPTVSASACKVGPVTPDEPKVTLPAAESVTYVATSREIVGGKFRYTVTATPMSEIFIINAGKLGTGWGAPMNGVSAYTSGADVPACATLVAPRADVDTCPVRAATPIPPSASFSPVEGLEFSKPKIEVRDKRVTATVTTATKPGFQIGGILPEGWTRVGETTVEFSAIRDQPAYDTPTPTLTVPPSVTPIPAPTTIVALKPVRPGLPKTGA